jgi:hypothetical protein
VRGDVLRIARYRLQATFGARWRGLLALALLIGVVGGIATGSVGAARRTQSAFPALVAGTNPSDLSVVPGAGGGGANYSAALTNTIARLPRVKRVESGSVQLIVPLWPNGAPRVDPNAIAAKVIGIGSIDGLYFDQDRVSITKGQMADPNRPDEIVMGADAARVLGLRVGQVVPLGFYTRMQTDSPGFGTDKVQPALRVEAKLVGLGVLSSELIQDDIDRYPAHVLLTPALTRMLLTPALATNAGFTDYGLQLAHGGRDVVAVEEEINRAVPSATLLEFHTKSVVEAQAERSIKPESIALGAFGAIAALAALVIAGQAIARQLRVGADDLQVLRALGAGPAMASAADLAGVLVAVLLGSLIAIAVAVGLSPLAPIGPVRHVSSSREIAFDWTVLGIGFAALAGGLSAFAVGLAYRLAPHRAARRQGLRATRRPRIMHAAVASGLPAPALAGVGFALGRGPDREASPLRSAIVSNVLAVATLVATLTFGSSLATLVTHPALYGWNWSYALRATSGSAETPPQVQALLDHDRVVTGWTAAEYFDLQFDGQEVPVLLAIGKPGVTPPILSGQPINGPGQVVLGVATLAQLHKRVGDSVLATYGSSAFRSRLRIVGTATLPAVGFSEGLHTSMGTGGLLQPPAEMVSSLNGDPGCGPTTDVVFIRLRRGLSGTAGLAEVQRLADGANKVLAAFPSNASCSGDTFGVLPVQRPAEIVNSKSIGGTPTILACALAGAAVVALALTLLASVRRRRRELALLKTLGFTRRQLAAVVVWQSSIAAGVGLAVGVPFGVAIGRQLWILFARDIYAVPKPTLPITTVLALVVAALVLANLVAAIPGRRAARTPAAEVLRTG